jgi:NADH-quinone oxidoreductase subunit L
MRSITAAVSATLAAAGLTAMVHTAPPAQAYNPELNGRFTATLIGTLSLSGIPPFSGFFSKDAILAAALDHGWYGELLWVAGMAGTFLTGLYAFRMVFVVFWGEPSPFVREHLMTGSHAHAREGHLSHDGHGSHEHSGEGPFSMTSTVGILMVLGAIGGFLQFAGIWTPLSDWLEPVARPLVEASGTQEAVSSVLAVLLGLAGIGVAWALYGSQPTASRMTIPRGFASRLLERKFYFDELYDALFYRPAVALANALRRDIEEPVIERSLDEIGSGTIEAGGELARVQTGLLRTYALVLAAAVYVLVVVFVAVR